MRWFDFVAVSIWIAAASASSLSALRCAQAQTAYPSRPVKIIVPIGAGGSYDLVGRFLASRSFPSRWGQGFFVENPHRRRHRRRHAGRRRWAAPDGYTLLMGGLSNIVFNAARSGELALPAADGFRAGRARLKFPLCAGGVVRICRRRPCTTSSRPGASKPRINSRWRPPDPAPVSRSSAPPS